MARVSIGMPVFNGERYLSLAIDSLLNQTFTDFDVLISDNCSTDRTIEIAEQYAATDDRIRIIRQDQNLGAIKNFNFVFENTDAKYFKWAAADDICQPEYLEKCVAALDDRPDAVWSHSHSDKIDSSGISLIAQLEGDKSLLQEIDGEWTWKGFPRDAYDSNSAATRFSDVLLGTTWCVDSYGLIRRSALEKTRLFIDTYGAEKVLMAELSLLGKYAHVPQILFAQRIHEEASSAIVNHKEQQKYVGSKSKGFIRTRLGLFFAHFKSVNRHRLGFVQKSKAYLALLRYIFQVDKWAKITKDLIFRRGVGGGGKRLLDQAKKTSAAKETTPHHKTELASQSDAGPKSLRH